MAHRLRVIERRRYLRAATTVGATLLAAAALVIPTAAVAQVTSSPAVAAEGWTGRPLPAPSGVPDNPVTGPVTGGVDQNAPSVEIQANTLPVGLRNGEPSHQSYLKFELPALEDGASVVGLELVLTEEGSNAHEPTAILACMALAEWPAEAGFAWSERPETDPDACDPGVRAEDGTWTFNLTFPAEEWLDSGVTNHGIAFLPGGPENLPVGEPDPQTLNYLVSFGGVEAENPPQTELTVLPAPAPEPEPTNEPEPVVPPAQQDSGNSGGSGGSGGSSFFSTPTFEEAPAAPGPEVAGPADGSAPPVEQEPVGVPVATGPVPVQTPAYLWGLIPLFVLGMFALSRALVAPVGPLETRAGATSRLLERRRRERDDAGTVPAYQV